MKIVINDQPFEVYEYDDDTTILEKYAFSIPGSLPSFFRIENKDFIIEDGMSLEISNVNERIKELTEENLREPSVIESILLSYPKLKKRDIGILWILANYDVVGDKITGPINVDVLKILDRIAFLTPAKAASTTSDFIKGIAKERERLGDKIKREKKIFDSLAKYKAVDGISPFALEEVIFQSVLRLPNGENLLDVFDAWEPSKNVPFIILARKKKIYYKIFKHLIPPNSWVDFIPPVEGIYFKILNVAPSKLSSRLLVENLYSDGIWSVDNRIEIGFKARIGMTEESIKKRVFDSLGDRVDYEIVMTRQTAIKGVFTIQNINFDKSIFADLVATNETFRFFLFFNEKNKTVLTKPRFYIYYAPDQQGVISNSLALTITPQLEEGKQSVVIRVSHALNSQQANAARLITSKLFSLYLQEYDKISDVYASLISDFRKTVVYSRKKEDKKTGPRATALRKTQPEMFGSRYPDQCQKERQPYVLTATEAADKAIELGDPHKVMFFEGLWYACEPREPYLDPLGNKDKDDKHLFPGLKENKPKTKDTEHDKDYQKKFKLLPCCFTQDQYEKKASQLRKYRENLETGRVEPDFPEREAGAGYIVGANKRLPAGRFGELPFNWEKLLGYLGIEKVTRGKQDFYPILRHGVISAPDSFIHCLERAFNPRYNSLTVQEKKDQVETVRVELANSNLNIGRQELYDYPSFDIKEMLLDPNEYIAPELFVSLVQQYYNCNIFIYVMDTSHPNGDVVIPRNSQAFLSRDIDETKKTVLIIKYETETDDYPYQCEIVCQMDVKNGKVRRTEFVFENSPIVKMAVELFYNANEVFVVSPDGYEPYRQVPEL